MQLEGMLLILIMLIIIPVLAISSNDAAFFIVTAILISFSSIKSIYAALLKVKDESDDDKDEVFAEIEEQVDMDLSKIGTGIKVIKNLVIVLFFGYCSFFLNTFWLKALCAFVIIYWVNDIRLNLRQKENSTSQDYFSLISRFLVITISISSLLLISLSAYNRFIFFK
ncbi:MAG: hypothetical protein ACOYWZ_05170 [Bacillota bacterium]